MWPGSREENCNWFWSRTSGSAPGPFQQHRPDGGVELSERRHGAAEPDLDCRSVDVDKVNRDKPALELAVVDHQMGDRPSPRVNDQADQVAADPIGTADVSPDRERHRSCHGRAPRPLGP
jgi:hypothetical protein